MTLVFHYLWKYKLALFMKEPFSNNYKNLHFTIMEYFYLIELIFIQNTMESSFWIWINVPRKHYLIHYFCYFIPFQSHFLFLIPCTRQKINTWPNDINFFMRIFIQYFLLFSSNLRIAKKYFLLINTWLGI